jgi:uncharacterized protein (UPF0262 family)
MTADKNLHKICHILLDEASILRRHADVEHERRVAIYDLLEENYFKPNDEFLKGYGGPYRLTMRTEDSRLVLDIATIDEQLLRTIILPLSSLRRTMKEYFLVCNSYFDAIRTASPRQIETIDMGRRGLHNDGAEILKERLSAKIEIDFGTARRLFTLICVLQVR